jgi:hypothetical protein
MPPSERSAAATQTASTLQAEPEDDIVERTPSHPVTTTLLIVSSIALIFGIGLTGTEIGRYVNKRTREDLQNFATSAVRWSDDSYKSWWKEQAQRDPKNFTDDEFKRIYGEEISADVEPVRRTRKAPKATEEAPPEKAAPAEGEQPPADKEAPKEAAPADAPAEGGGGS